MTVKLVGAILIIFGCGGFGLVTVIQHKRNEAALRQLIDILNYMECELQYRLPPLPDLCEEAGKQGKGSIYNIFIALANEMNAQICPDAASCMNSVIASSVGISSSIQNLLSNLGKNLGKFDVSGQLKAMESIRKECNAMLEALEHNREQRLRSYQTLWLCAGAALAILLI